MHQKLHSKVHCNCTNFAAMITREQEPDYRTLSEVQLKYELIQLEKRVLRITGDPLASGARATDSIFAGPATKTPSSAFRS